MIVNKYLKIKDIDDLVMQANSGDKIFKLLEIIKEHPLSKNEIARVFGFDSRQADYYSMALGAMGLAAIYEYPTTNLIGVTESGKLISTKKELAKYLSDINFISDSESKNKTSPLAHSTKNRRKSAIENLDKWIKENK